MFFRIFLKNNIRQSFIFEKDEKKEKIFNYIYYTFIINILTFESESIRDRIATLRSI